MAGMLADRVQETSTTGGTGNLTLAGAYATGYSSFNTAFGVGTSTTNTFYYVITQDQLWESGIGHLSASTTLVRDTVLSNSSGNTSAISFAATTAIIFNSPPASRFTDWHGEAFANPVMKNYGETINAMGNISGAVTIALSSGNVVTATVTSTISSVSFTLPTLPVSTNNAFSVTLFLTNGGSFSVTWGSTIKWAQGGAPILSTGLDILTFMTVNGGTTWNGMLASGNSS